MTLITSISGIRGTIGGRKQESLTPSDILRFVSAYAGMIRSRFPGSRIKVVVGRDGRCTGAALSRLVCGTLQFCGVDVVNLGLSTTPSIEMAVVWHKAHGGIILSASHNPAEWNALKLLDDNGEFISEEDGNTLLVNASRDDMEYPGIEGFGNYSTDYQSIERHVEAVLDEKLVDTEAIRKAGFRIAFDGINSTGGIAIPLLLKELGVKEVFPLNEKPDGNFQHNPEPLPENLTDIIEKIRQTRADVGLVVDPDVDRLAIVCEDGSPFGEEYTLVAIADYVLSQSKGDTVSNLSSTRALRDITERYGCKHHSSAVGEVHVVAMMKSVDAVIGGEGNGGVILPSLHYGRDALAGIALFLTLLAKSDLSCSELRQTYPDYHIRKNRMQLLPDTNVDLLFDRIASHYQDAEINRIDGLKIDLPEGWIHIRKSNTEPIIRIYSEAATPEEADKLAGDLLKLIEK